jgi:glycolate oxidase FAD binding subunit
MMTPKTEAELAEMVAAATGPLVVQGGGTRGMSVAGDPLSVAGLSGVALYEPGALTLVAQAGTPVAEIEAVLAAENQRLAFEPMDHRGLLGTSGEPTIGGVMAANISGPRRIQAGAARDFLLGVRYVDGMGTVVKNGGRVMKNVTGYDLVKLMSGSWGTLGVLSEVALKVLPGVETETTLTLSGLRDADAVAAMSAALGSPFEVSGAAHDPGADGGPVTLLRIEGFVDSVAYRAGRLVDLLSTFGAADQSADADASRRVWAGIRDVGAFQAQPGDVWRMSVKPSDAPGLVAAIKPDGVVYDWGGGLVWMRMPEGADLRARAGVFAGHATLIRGSRETKRKLGMFQPEPAPLAAISAGLRARFDPRGRLNAGLMG